MSQSTIVLVGGPDSGKTNYLARLWKSLRDGDGRLLAPNVPQDISYVEEALEHLLKGEFAPRSDKNVEESERNFSIPLVSNADREAMPIDVVVPDVTGELWKKAVETGEIPQKWMSGLEEASGALVFVRVGSDQNIDPLDWVTCSGLIRLHGEDKKDRETTIPTQVALCEIIRFLETRLATKHGKLRPRVSIVITAWDLLDGETSARGPAAYIRNQYPMLSGRLSDTERLDVRLFGVSVVSGDFVDDNFKKTFFETDLKDSGYVIIDRDGSSQKEPDLTLPIAWATNIT